MPEADHIVLVPTHSPAALVVLAGSPELSIVALARNWRDHSELADEAEEAGRDDAAQMYLTSAAGNHARMVRKLRELADPARI